MHLLDTDTLTHLYHGNPDPQLSIVILNWNVADLLVACLRSLPAAAGDWWPHTEVIVIDNASTDHSLDIVRANFPDVYLIALPENLGFAAGTNIGIRASKGKYILLLNPDTVCHPRSIALLCDYMEAYPQTGITGPRLLNPDGTLQPSRRRFPTPAIALIESTPLQPFLPNAPALRRFYMLDRPDDASQTVDWLSGAALLCRREAFDQAGLLDPGYFMFSEEVDLCRRITNAGWTVAYVPQAQITHCGGQSTDQALASRHINFNTSKARYFRLHEGRITGNLVRFYLLGTYIAQSISESAKWLLGHKRPLRAARLRMYSQVLRSGLRPQRRQHPQLTAKPILLITGEYPPARGGVGDYTCKLAQSLHKQDVETQALTRRHDLDEGRRTEDGGSEGSGIRDQTKSEHFALRTPHSAFRITPSVVLRALKRSRASLAHIQYQTGAYEMRPIINLLPLLLKLRWHGPTVVTFHDLLVPYLFPKAGLLREWANRLLARTATAAIATNPVDAAHLRSWGVRRLELIPIGPNIPNDPPPDFDRASWRAEHGISPGTTLLAYFGFLNSTKGLDDLLQALAVLRERDTHHCRLMMVGGSLGASDPTNRATASQLEALAGTLGVAGNLLWTGYLHPQQVSAALLSADIAVLPYTDGASFRRGSLLAVLEHGLPVVTTTSPRDQGLGIGDRGSGIGDRGLGMSQKPKAKSQNPKLDWPVLEDGENALLAPAGDADALASAIERLASDAILREHLAAGARRLAVFFDWARIAQMHISLYDSLIQSSRHGRW